jgi:hypothetical protein
MKLKEPKLLNINRVLYVIIPWIVAEPAGFEEPKKKP